MPSPEPEPGPARGGARPPRAPVREHAGGGAGGWVADHVLRQVTVREGAVPQQQGSGVGPNAAWSAKHGGGDNLGTMSM
jgi:hypothetical protein